MAVDKSIEYYRDKTSTISFADGIACDLEEKTHPEAFGESTMTTMTMMMMMGDGVGDNDDQLDVSLADR